MSNVAYMADKAPCQMPLMFTVLFYRDLSLLGRSTTTITECIFLRLSESTKGHFYIFFFVDATAKPHLQMEK